MVLYDEGSLVLVRAENVVTVIDQPNAGIPHTLITLRHAAQGASSVGIRMPAEEVAEELLKALGSPT